jgi:hypothetical protein
VEEGLRFLSCGHTKLLVPEKKKEKGEIYCLLLLCLAGGGVVAAGI